MLCVIIGAPLYMLCDTSHKYTEIHESTRKWLLIQSSLPQRTTSPFNQFFKQTKSKCIIWFFHLLPIHFLTGWIVFLIYQQTVFSVPRPMFISTATTLKETTILVFNALVSSKLDALLTFLLLHLYAFSSEQPELSL